jgi:hypothetical protein
MFYLKHKVGYYAASYQYQQAAAKSQEKVQEFAIALAKLIQQQALIVYTDESSFNMWMKMKATWMSQQ